MSKTDAQARQDKINQIKKRDGKIARYLANALLIIAAFYSTIYALYPDYIKTIPSFLKPFFNEQRYFAYIVAGIGLFLDVKFIISLYVRAITSLSSLIFKLAISYLSTIYCFAIIYAYLMKDGPGHFSVEKMDLFTAVYFSVACISTAGFGDIAPVSGLAKLVVSFEIFFGIAFNIFAFSVVSSLTMHFVKITPRSVVVNEVSPDSVVVNKISADTQVVNEIDTSSGEVTTDSVTKSNKV